MACDCHETDAAHAADEAQAMATYLPQYEAEKRQGLVEHCPECVREARGDLVAAFCLTPVPGHGAHVLCEFHR